MLLPFLDEQALYADYRFDEPWDGPNNSLLAERIPEIFRCPSFVKSRAHHPRAGEVSNVMSNYVAVMEPGTVISDETPVSYLDIADGTSNAIVLIESRNHSVHWMNPVDISTDDLIRDLSATGDENRANHISGIHVLLADGTVRFISRSIDKVTLRRLLTHSDGEMVGGF